MTFDVTYVDSSKMKNLEEYAISLVAGMVSLKTLEQYHLRAIEIGIMPEDLSCRANTIVWDLRRTLSLYQKQLEEVLELLPTEYNIESLTEVLKAQHLTKARSITRKKREKIDGN